VQDLTVAKDSLPPVPEDHVARQVRCFAAAQEKKDKDAVKKQRSRKILEREALIKRCRKQRLEGLPEEESPSEMTSGEEDDDDDDDDAELRYDTATTLAYLPDVRFLQEPVGGGSTSQASRVASAPIEGEEEWTEGRAHEGPSGRRSAEPVVLPSSSVALHPRARSPWTSLAGKSTPPPPETRAPSSGVRTRGQMASAAKRTPEASSTKALRSPGLTKGPTEGSSQKPSSGLGKPGAKPLIPMSG
jgi:hypothetical protein